jgi:hypothetical protein
MSKELITITETNALEIFTGERLDDYLSQIEKSAKNFVADVATATGRKEIASAAYRVAQEKIKIDALGKALVEDWKKKAGIVDQSRKKSRDFLDNLKLEIRKPLTEWEEAEEARVKAEADAKELSEAWEAAQAEDILFNRQKEIERKEAEIREREEAEAKKKEEERLKIEAAKREKEIAEAARIKAEKEAEEKIEAEKRARIESELRAKREAEEAARQAEIAKEQAIRAEREAAAKREADRIESERKAKVEKEIAEEKARKEAEAKAANVAHQRKVNNEALSCLVKNGISESQGKEIIKMIATHKIKHIEIKY